MGTDGIQRPSLAQQLEQLTRQLTSVALNEPHLHEVMNGLQVRQVVIGDVHADTEIEPGVAPINDLKVPKLGEKSKKGEGEELKGVKKGGFWGEKGGFWGADLDEIGVFGIADGDDGVDLLDELLLLVVVKLHVPLGQAGLPSAVLDEDEADLPPPPTPKCGVFGGVGPKGREFCPQSATH